MLVNVVANVVTLLNIPISVSLVGRLAIRRAHGKTGGVGEGLDLRRQPSALEDSPRCLEQSHSIAGGIGACKRKA